MNLCKDCKYVDKSYEGNFKCYAPSNMTLNFVSGEIEPILKYCENIRKSPECNMFVANSIKETTHDFYKDSYVTTS